MKYLGLAMILVSVGAGAAPLKSKRTLKAPTPVAQVLPGTPATTTRETLSCAGTLLGERVCASVPTTDEKPVRMITSDDLDGTEADPEIASGASLGANDVKGSESRNGTLAVAQGMSVNSEIDDLQDRLKGWQEPGERSLVPISLRHQTAVRR